MAKLKARVKELNPPSPLSVSKAVSERSTRPERLSGRHVQDDQGEIPIAMRNVRDGDVMTQRAVQLRKNPGNLDDDRQVQQDDLVSAICHGLPLTLTATSAVDEAGMARATMVMMVEMTRTSNEEIWKLTRLPACLPTVAPVISLFACEWHGHRVHVLMAYWIASSARERMKAIMTVVKLSRAASARQRKGQSSRATASLTSCEVIRVRDVIDCVRISELGKIPPPARRTNVHKQADLRCFVHSMHHIFRLEPNVVVCLRSPYPLDDGEVRNKRGNVAGCANLVRAGKCREDGSHGQVCI